MTELLDVYDANGKLIGPADRNVVHAYGLWHKTIHCWIVWNSKLVFQRRSRQDKTNPGRLYTTASGHVAAGETIEAAFVREIAQEIEIRPENPDFLDEFLWIKDMKRLDGSVFADRVFANIFWAEHKGALEDFRFSDGEVDSVVAVDLEDFIKWASNPAGKIAGLEWDGKKVSSVSLSADDFLLNAGETIRRKFGIIAEMIKGRKA